MSYNNFSYYNGPNAPTQYWGPNDTIKPTFEEVRSVTLAKPQINNAWTKTIMTPEYNAQNFPQASTQGYAQSMILPSENRPVDPVPAHHEVMQGTVTQLFANFGYINDIIIFSKSDVMGQMVQVGDKVAVDATYQPNNPTKYKGERVYKIDEARFNSVVNTNSSKMKPLIQGNSARIETPSRSRHDKKFISPEPVPRNEPSIKHRLDYKYEDRHLSPRGDSSIKSRLDYRRDNRDLSPRMDLSIKSRLDYKYNSRDLSPRSRSPSKNQYDYRYETQKSSPRMESSSIKNRLDYKYESSNRPDEGIPSNKRNVVAKSKYDSIKDRLTIKNKISSSDKRNDAKKFDIIRKTEDMKRKAISPIKFQVSPQETLSGKRKSESRTKLTPKMYENFSYSELDGPGVKNLYRSLVLPKQFFHMSLKYQNSFPLNHPMKLGNNCHFKVMDKKVKSIDPFVDAQLKEEVDPYDADTTYIAKVMLISTDDLAKFYKDTLNLAEEFEGENKIPITKAIKFLVASVGQNKEFGIGGAWSPSLDGPDPETNPRVLINTAIRTCKAMTGIDLSNCSSWPKFLELHYYRPLQQIKKKTTNNKDISNNPETIIDVDAVDELIEYKEPRMETVVYFIPDVWNNVPSTDSWNEITRLYQESLACIMCPPSSTINPISPTVTTMTAITNTPDTNMANINSNADSTNGDKNVITIEEDKKADGGDREEEDWNFNEMEEVDDKNKNSEATTEVKEGEQATHYSKLVIAGLKIVDIKKELALRKLNNRGVMEQLKARLKAVLEKEESDEKNKDCPPVVVPPVSIVKPASMCAFTEEQKAELKKCYSLPDRPEIIVHQNRHMYENQMKIRKMSLHSLLSYNNVTLQENTFELALFARQFLDMLRRDAVFNIYKSIVVADEIDLSCNDDSAKRAKLMVTTSKRTVNKPLLFSCTLLDRDKTNKISLDELRMYIEGLGICLSADQLTGVLGKVKDSSKYLNYRQLTDKEMADTDIANLLTVNVNEDLDYIKELAIGNKALFESEMSGIDSSIHDDQIERLKNELDKSERSRQTIELKVAEMKDETERNINNVQVYVKEIAKLKEQLLEYRDKYHDEQDRSEFYKHDFERMLRYMRDVDKMTVHLNKFVSDSLVKYNVDPKKDINDDSVIVVEDNSKIEKQEDDIVCLDISEEENHVSIESSNDVDVPEKTSDPVNNDPELDVKEETAKEIESAPKVTVAVHNCMEDFDLSKPSDYDMIIIDETE